MATTHVNARIELMVIARVVMLSVVHIVKAGGKLTAVQAGMVLGPTREERELKITIAGEIRLRPGFGMSAAGKLMSTAIIIL